MASTNKDRKELVIMYNNTGAAGGVAAGAAGTAGVTALPDTGGLALMPFTGTVMDWVLLPVAVFALVGGVLALLRILPRGEA